MKVIDARGLSCPEPVVLLRSAMESNEDAYQIIVDNHASRENTTRYAQHQGYQVAVSEKDGEWTLTFTKWPISLHSSLTSGPCGISSFAGNPVSLAV